MNENFEDWITYGIVCKIPISKVKKLKEFINRDGQVIYSRISGGKLFLKEASPSGGVDSGN